MMYVQYRGSGKCFICGRNKFFPLLHGPARILIGKIDILFWEQPVKQSWPESHIGEPTHRRHFLWVEADQQAKPVSSRNSKRSFWTTGVSKVDGRQRFFGVMHCSTETVRRTSPFLYFLWTCIVLHQQGCTSAPQPGGR